MTNIEIILLIWVLGFFPNFILILVFYKYFNNNCKNYSLALMLFSISWFGFVKFVFILKNMYNNKGLK